LQLLVSDNAALMEEILRRGWVTPLLRWLQPLPTALPPSHHSCDVPAPPPAQDSCMSKIGSDSKSSGTSNISEGQGAKDTTDSCTSGTSVADKESDLLPVSKKRKNHEVACQSGVSQDDHSDHEENSSNQVDISDLEALRHQRLHLQIGALWALTNLAAGKYNLTSLSFGDIHLT
jgi:hypothetical protein